MQLSIEEYLKECWKNKQEVIDVSAYKLNEEELNKVIFGIHYENPEYYCCATLLLIKTRKQAS